MLDGKIGQLESNVPLNSFFSIGSLVYQPLCGPVELSQFCGPLLVLLNCSTKRSLVPESEVALLIFLIALWESAAVRAS